MCRYIICLLLLTISVSAEKQWWVKDIPDDKNAAIEWLKIHKISSDNYELFSQIDLEVSSLEKKYDKRAYSRLKQQMSLPAVKKIIF